MNILPVSGSGHPPSPRSLKAELIVHLALLRIRKDVVGFLHLLEFFFRGFVAGIQVRMIFARKLPVSLANFLLYSLPGNAEKFVVILLGSCGHMKFSDS